jgi:hypothetical protein
MIAMAALIVLLLSFCFVLMGTSPRGHCQRSSSLTPVGYLPRAILEDEVPIPVEAVVAVCYREVSGRVVS